MLQASYVESVTDSTATVKIGYIPPASGVTVKLMIQSLSEGAGDTDAIQKTLSTLKGVGEILVTLKRDTAKDLIFTVNSTEGFVSGVNVTIIKEPTPKIIPEVMPILVQAKDFVRGTNVAIDQCTTGPGILANAPPCHARPNAAEFDFSAKKAGKYNLAANFTAAAGRPVKVSLNGKVIRDQALSENTGSWLNSGLKWFEIGEVTLKEGANTLRIERADVFPHIHAFKFKPK